MALSLTYQFTLPGLTMAALGTHATASHTPVLCLHGWLDNAASFVPLAEYLPDQPLLALEFAGHGHSSHRSIDASYYFFDWVYDVVRLCRQQQWQQLTVIGHSMGGMVATALAASFPELVQKLVLIDSLGFITAPPEQAAQQLRQGIESRLKASSKTPCYPNVESAAEARQRQSDFGLEQARLLAQRGTITTESGVCWRADMRLRHTSPYRLSPEQAQTFITATSCPILAILAPDSRFNQQNAALLKGYQNITSHNVSGGHHCHMTEAATVARHITRFISR